MNSSRPSAGATRQIDADFAHEVLTDLYRYRRKRALVVWLLWGLLGLLGAHRFYLGRDGTALLMLFTAGGGGLWWLVDAFLIGSYVRDHNAEQARRREAGLPPLELDFMPPLNKDLLQEPPAWTEQWRARGTRWQALRFAGDCAVLLTAGLVLGSLSGTDGAEEAIAAIVAVVAVTALGGATAGLQHVPAVSSLIRWSHRLRLFYYFNEPKSPLGLLARSIVGLLHAPFRKRERAEVRLYLELGFVFTLAFLLLDFIEHVVRPESANLGDLIGIWLMETTVTFFVTYAFAAPIGAVLTLYLLVRPTHTVPRLLAGIALAAILTGVALSGS